MNSPNDSDNEASDMHGFANTDVKINGRSDHGVSLAEDGDNYVYTMTLTGMGSGSHINGDGNINVVDIVQLLNIILNN